MGKITDYSTMANPNNLNQKDLSYFEMLENFFNNTAGTSVSKLKNFSLYVPRQDLTRFLAKYEIFKQILNVSGSIVECGVLHGQGLMTFAHLSSIFEHLNYQRKIIGFDTFEGFPSDGVKDDNPEYAKKHVLKIENSYNTLLEAIKYYDYNRFLNTEPKIELVKGNMLTTVPNYLKENPHTVVSLLYIDCDLYEPTKVALENFIPRMPKGSVLAFDDLNDKTWPGETTALIDSFGIRDFKFQRFPFDTRIAYAVL